MRWGGNVFFLGKSIRSSWLSILCFQSPGVDQMSQDAQIFKRLIFFTALVSIVSVYRSSFWCSKVFPVTGWLLAHLVKCRASSTWCYNLYWLSRNIAKMIKKRHTWHCTPNKTTTTAEHTPGVIFISLVVVLFRSTKFLPRTHHFLRREEKKWKLHISHWVSIFLFCPYLYVWSSTRVVSHMKKWSKARITV